MKYCIDRHTHINNNKFNKIKGIMKHIKQSRVMVYLWVLFLLWTSSEVSALLLSHSRSSFALHHLSLQGKEGKPRVSLALYAQPGTRRPSGPSGPGKRAGPSSSRPNSSRPSSGSRGPGKPSAGGGRGGPGRSGATANSPRVNTNYYRSPEPPSPPRGKPRGGNSRPAEAEEEVVSPVVEEKKGKNYAMQSITGQNIVVCRTFNLDSRKEFEFIGSYRSLPSMPIYPVPDIAFVGRSNVGKSSLLNCITGLNKDIAVESKVPGRTQCMNLFKCKDPDGDICVFADLPGYGYAKISKDVQAEISRFVNEYLKKRGALKLTIVLIDIRREPQESDYNMIKLLVEEGIPFAIVATKIDKLKKSEVQKNLRVIQEAYGLPSRLFLPFSAVTGEGKRDVWRLIRSSVLSQGPAYEGLEMDETDEEEEDDGRYIIESADDENEETGDDYEDDDDDGTIDRDLINP